MDHIIFYNLPNAGASIVMPVLEEFAAQAGCEHFSGPKERAHVQSEVDSGRRAFHWTHSGPESFADWVGNDAFRFICLTRDPRDVLVSHVKDCIHRDLHEGKSENELYLEYIESSCRDMFDDANSWRALDDQPNVLNLTFEALKRNIPAGLSQILEFARVPATENGIQEACARHSFESVTQRRRGQTGEAVRNQFLFRKGISGDWANQFSGDVALQFHEEFGGLMRSWHYESNGEWARAHARYKSAERKTARERLGELLGKHNTNPVPVA